MRLQLQRKEDEELSDNEIDMEDGRMENGSPAPPQHRNSKILFVEVEIVLLVTMVSFIEFRVFGIFQKGWQSNIF